MSVVRARILRTGGSPGMLRPRESALSVAGGRRLAAVESAALERARATLDLARHAADAIVAEAHREAAAIRLSAQESGRAEALVSLAGSLITAARRTQAANESAVDRSIALATLLAERILGEALRLDPSRIATLVRTALSEAAGASTVSIVLHPEDSAALETQLSSFPHEPLLSIAADASLERGDVRLVTDVGTVQAKLGARLARLAARLSQVLQR